MAQQTSDTAVLSRALDASNGNLSPDAARSILDIGLAASDKTRASELSALAGDGTLSAEQEAELGNLRHAGRVLELLKSKARLALKASGQDS
jgi:hypothetical protein